MTERPERLSEEWLYRAIWEIFSCNGSVRFDSDTMDKHNEDWVRHVSRNLARWIEEDKEPTAAFWEKVPVDPPITVEMLMDLETRYAISKDAYDAEMFSDACGNAESAVYSKFQKLRIASNMMKYLTDDEIELARKHREDR